MDIDQPQQKVVSPDSVHTKCSSPIARSPVNYLSNQTFAQKLLQNDMFPNMVDALVVDAELLDETIPENSEKNFILITAADLIRLYSPWQSSLIVKLMGLKLGYPILKQKLQDLWKLSEELIMIDLGCDFYLIKFAQMQNMLNVLHDGPWFIFNNFLSVQKWEPKFVSSQARITHTAIWTHLL
ncbi:hypothetical protein P3S67_023495 [Capsicum chacoense]